MKKIGVSSLKPGDRVLQLDRPWQDTPFLRSFTATPDSAAKLSRAGVRHVFIADDDGVHVPTSAISDELNTAISDQLETSGYDINDFEPEYVDFQKADNAVDLYEEALRLIRRMMDDVKAGKSFNKTAVRGLADRIVDCTIAHPVALASIAKIREFDEYTYQHSLNVSVFAAALGRKLKLGEDDMRMIAFGGLLHDIGKLFVDETILKKPGPLTPDEYEHMKLHVAYGVDYAAKHGLDSAAMPMVGEHHERADGSGYPFALKEDDISQFGKIAAVVDVYDAITSDRVYHKAVDPHAALKMMFSWADKHLSRSIFEFFVANIGIFPVGTLLALNTGEVAVVAKTNNKRPTDPLIAVFKSKSGIDIAPILVDLSRKSLHSRQVVGPLNPAEVSIPVGVRTLVAGMNSGDF